MSKTNSPEVFLRKLIYIPIIHTQVDMGTLNEPIRQATLQNIGQTALNRKIYLIDKMWTKIEQVIDGLDISYKKVLLYQDGLPVCGEEFKIVTELAKAGSRNHQLLLRMMKKGATIMGTESLELLMEEYELAKQVITEENIQKSSAFRNLKKALSDSLLNRRDQFIANRINSTLSMGKTGILFLGMLHSAGNFFDEDIQVIYPINQHFDLED